MGNEQVLGTIVIGGEEITLIATTYSNNGRAAVIARDNDGLPYGTLSVNLPAEDLSPDEIAVKTYSDNAPWWQVAAMSGCFMITGRSLRVGHAVAPVWRIVGFRAGS